MAKKEIIKGLVRDLCFIGIRTKSQTKETITKAVDKLETEMVGKYAHPTIPNWCCACEADKAFILGRIADNCECKKDWRKILNF